MVPPPPTEDEIAIKEGWYVDDYDGALEEAKKQGKPLLLTLLVFIVLIAG